MVRPRALNAVYAIGMSTSNLLAMIELLRWAHRASSLHLMLRGAPVVITVILLYFRQKEMHTLVRRGSAKVYGEE